MEAAPALPPPAARRRGGGNPPDALVAHACFFLLGSGLLAPWNALLTATDYYAAVFPGSHVERTLTLCYLPTCLFFLVATAYLPRRFPRPFFRAWSSYAAFAVLMAALAIAEAVLPPAVGRIAAVTALVGVFDGLGQGAVFGSVAATMPPSMLHAVVGGTSASGLLICLLRMATKAALPATPQGLRASVCVYFGIAALVAAACVAAYAGVLPRLPVVRRHLLAERQRRRRRRLREQQYEQKQQQREQQDERRERNSSGGGGKGKGNKPPLLPPARLSLCGGGGASGGPRADGELEMSPKQSPSLSANGAEASSAEEAAAGGGGGAAGQGEGGGAPASDAAAAPLLLHSPLSSQPLPSSAAGPRPATPLPLLEGAGHEERDDDDDAAAPARPSAALASRAVIPCAALASVYVVSLAIFPGVLGEDLADPKLGGWYPLALFTAYNAGDLAGKLAPLGAWAERRATDAALLAAALSRAAVFFPAYVAARAAHAPPWSVGLITLLLGLSNGWLTAALMTLAPRRLADKGGDDDDGGDGGGGGGGSDAEAVENLLVIALVVGLLLGATASWLWVV